MATVGVKGFWRPTRGKFLAPPQSCCLDETALMLLDQPGV